MYKINDGIINIFGSFTSFSLENRYECSLIEIGIKISHRIIKNVFVMFMLFVLHQKYHAELFLFEVYLWVKTAK